MAYCSVLLVVLVGVLLDIEDESPQVGASCPAKSRRKCPNRAAAYLTADLVGLVLLMLFFFIKWVQTFEVGVLLVLGAFGILVRVACVVVCGAGLKSAPRSTWVCSSTSWACRCLSFW